MWFNQPINIYFDLCVNIVKQTLTKLIHIPFEILVRQARFPVPFNHIMKFYIDFYEQLFLEQFWEQNPEYSGKLGQYYGCWCPALGNYVVRASGVWHQLWS